MLSIKQRKTRYLWLGLNIVLILLIGVLFFLPQIASWVESKTINKGIPGYLYVQGAIFPWEKKFQKGNELILADKKDEALEYYISLYEAIPGDQQRTIYYTVKENTLIRIVELAQELQKEKTVEKYYKKLTKFRPRKIKYYLDFAKFYSSQKEYKNALEQVEEALALDITNWQAFQAKVELLHALERNEELVQYYHEYVEADYLHYTTMKVYLAGDEIKGNQVFVKNGVMLDDKEHTYTITVAGSPNMEHVPDTISTVRFDPALSSTYFEISSIEVLGKSGSVMKKWDDFSAWEMAGIKKEGTKYHNIWEKTSMQAGGVSLVKEEVHSLRIHARFRRDIPQEVLDTVAEVS